jgi:hypothetical protein
MPLPTTWAVRLAAAALLAPRLAAADTPAGPAEPSAEAPAAPGTGEPAIIFAPNDLRLDAGMVTVSQASLEAIAVDPPQEAAPGLRVTHRGVGKFRLLADGSLAFVPASQVPLVPGERFGWVVRFDTSRDALKLTEIFRLPEPINITGDSSKTTISDDGKTATTPRDFDRVWDWTYNYWAFDATDPAGKHSFEVLLEDGRPVFSAEFVVTR